MSKIKYIYLLLILSSLIAGENYSETLNISFPYYSVKDIHQEFNNAATIEEGEENYKKYLVFLRENKYIYQVLESDLFEIFREKKIQVFSKEIYQKYRITKEINSEILFDQFKTHMLIKKDTWSFIESSYKKYIISKDFFGESYLSFSTEEYEYPTIIDFTFEFIYKNKFITVIYSFNDIDSKLASEMPRFFFNENSRWYFIGENEDSFIQALMNKESFLPEDLLVFLNDWDHIIERIISS